MPSSEQATLLIMFYCCYKIIPEFPLPTIAFDSQVYIPPNRPLTSTLTYISNIYSSFPQGSRYQTYYSPNIHFFLYCKERMFQPLLVSPSVPWFFPQHSPVQVSYWPACLNPPGIFVLLAFLMINTCPKSSLLQVWTIVSLLLVGLLKCNSEWSFYNENPIMSFLG
jgi:hypothetical protein